MAAVRQPLKPTGHHRPGEAMESLGEHRQGAAMPREDAHANKTYFGPAGTLKAATGLGRQGSDLNGRIGGQNIRDLQSRKRRK